MQLQDGLSRETRTPGNYRRVVGVSSKMMKRVL